MTDENFLSRWSRRKVEAKESKPAETPRQEEPKPAAASTTTPAAQPEPLPPVESLTFDSDFTAFMKPEVEPGLRREALKTLLQDPRFNVMDGLDVYIDDYSKPDPLPDGWLEKLNMVKRLGIFIEPREDAPPLPAEGAPPAATAAPATGENALEEHPLEGPAADSKLDTLRAANPPSEVGKS
jgi:hypothetical protein